MKQFRIHLIRKFREEKNMTQLDLANKIGVYVQQITAMENADGAKGITTTTLAKIADALGKSTDDFFTE